MHIPSFLFLSVQTLVGRSLGVLPLKCVLSSVTHYTRRVFSHYRDPPANIWRT